MALIFHLPLAVKLERGMNLNFITAAQSQSYPKGSIGEGCASSRCLKRQNMLLGKIVPKP